MECKMKKLGTILCTLSIFLLSSTFISTSAQELPEQLQNRYEQSQNEQPNKYFDQSDLRAKSVTDIGIDRVSQLAKDVFFETKNLWGTNMSMLSDQLSTTNLVYNWWEYAHEPRKQLNDNTSLQPLNFPFQNFTWYQFESLKAIQLLEDSSMTVTVDGLDVTDAMRANLYFLKGLSTGYLGLIYDQAMLAKRDVVYNYEFVQDITSQDISLADYNTVADSAIADLEEAITIAEGLPDSVYVWNLIGSPNDMNRQNFIKMVNSVIAKIMISTPRTYDEFINLDAATIISHAENGLDDNFQNIIFSQEGNYGFYDNYNEWSNLQLSGGAAYLPVDIKVQYLLDDEYPSHYPIDNNTVLDPAVSDDPRLDAYYEYTASFGFFDASRDRSLFTNYYSIRMYADNNWGREGQPFVFMTQSEMQYIKAEAEFLGGDVNAMNAALQNSPYGTSPTELEIDLPSVKAGYIAENGLAFGGPEISSDLGTLQSVLHKEYAVELHGLATIGTEWFMMRRHDMLQRGTALHYPVPRYLQGPLGLDYYNFGGDENYDQPGTATGENAWHEVPSIPIEFNANVENEALTLNWVEEPDEDVIGFKIYQGTQNLSLLDSLPETENSYQISGLTNNQGYDYSIVAVNETGESNTSPLRNVIPNLLGAPSNISYNDGDVIQNNPVSVSIPVTNFTSENIEVTSVDFNTAIQDTNLYENLAEFYSVDDGSFTLTPDESKNVEVTLNAELWGSFPEVDLVMQTDYNDEEVRASIAGGYIYKEDIQQDGQPGWNYYYDSPDSVAFGQMEAGEEKSIAFSMTNYNVSAIYLDTLYTEYYNPDSLQEYPDSVFSIVSPSPSDTIKIEPFETQTIEISANPVSSEPYEASLYTDAIGLRFYGTRTLNRLTVNRGDFVTTDNVKERPEVVSKFNLSNNYPNPFNPSTNIEFSIPNSGIVNLTVYNILGQKVATLVSKKLSVGQHSVNFDASRLSSGVYIYRLEHGGQTQIKKMTLIK